MIASDDSGRFREKVYKSWRHMNDRCRNPNDPDYHSYGGRGIKIGFGSFQEFYSEIGDPPSSLHSVDRFPDNNGNYEPGNVRWALPRDQTRNTRQNVWLTHNGKTQVLSDWVAETGLNRLTLHSRLKNGESGDYLFRPARKYVPDFKLIGFRNNRLEVVEYAGMMGENKNRPHWKCRCDCGNLKFIPERHLKIIQSCGCLQRDKAKETGRTLAQRRKPRQLKTN